MYGKLYRLGIDQATFQPDRVGRWVPVAKHTPVVCVRGLHVSWSFRVEEFAGTTGLVRLMDGISIVPCEGGCTHGSYDLKSQMIVQDRLWQEGDGAERTWDALCREVQERFGKELPAMGREFKHTFHDDGDSDTSLICMGELHVRRSCDEFGMGDSYSLDGLCDRSCRPRRIPLPPAVTRAIAKHLKSSRAEASAVA